MEATTCKKIGGLTGLLILMALVVNAQNIPISNPSFEGTIKLSGVPSPWFFVSGDADTYPLPDPGWHVPAASNGRTYVGMFVAAGGGSITAEAIGQQLPASFVPGVTYTLSIDLALGIISGETKPNITLSVYGSDPAGMVRELLWTSPPVNNTDWQTFTAQFTPKAAFNNIFLIPTADKNTPDCADVLYVDNMTGIAVSFGIGFTTTNACNGQATGTASVTGVGAGDGYTFDWEPGGATTAVATNLLPGNYQVTVTSPVGKKAYGNVTVKNSAVSVHTVITGVSCYGQSDGSIAVTAEGGIEPYKYSFNRVDNGTNAVNNVKAGAYGIIVTDSLGCIVQQSIRVPSPDSLTLQASAKAVSCSAVKNGQVTITPVGGTPPFQYFATGYPVQTDSTFRELDEGIYYLEVLDGHNCQAEGRTTVTKDWVECGVYVPNAFSPNGDGKNDLFRIKVQDAITDFRMIVMNRSGDMVYQSRDASAGWDGRDADAGTYAWVIRYTDSRGQLMQQKGWVVLVR